MNEITLSIRFLFCIIINIIIFLLYRVEKGTLKAFKYARIDAEKCYVGKFKTEPRCPSLRFLQQEKDSQSLVISPLSLEIRQKLGIS